MTDACGDALLQHGHHAEWAIPKKKKAMLRIITVYAWHTSKLRTSKDGNCDDTRLQKTWKMQNIVFSNKHHVFLVAFDFKGFGGPRYIYVDSDMAGSTCLMSALHGSSVAGLDLKL